MVANPGRYRLEEAPLPLSLLGRALPQADVISIFEVTRDIEQCSGDCSLLRADGCDEVPTWTVRTEA
jgi:hypothetical protein